MPTPTTWLDEFITNLETAGTQANPRVVALANGNFLVVWEDDNDTVADGFSTDIVGVIFNALGEPISDSLYLNFPFGFTRAEGIEDIAATPDGGFVVIYEFRSGDDGDLLMGLYDANGARIAQEFVISDDSVNGITYDNASVAVSPDGSFFVTFERDDGINQDIVGQSYNSNGSLDGALQEVRSDGFSNGADLENILETYTIALSDGRFATVFSENDNNGGANERTIELRISNADGTNSTLINNVSTVDGEPDSNPHVIELSDGRIMVAWQEDGDINARIFESNLTESVPEFALTFNNTLFFTLVGLVALEGGGYATVFRDDTQGRLFVNTGFDGTQDGFSTLVSDDASGTGGNITNVDASITTDGRILVTWENGEIYTEILDPRGTTDFVVDPTDGQFAGTDAADTFTGSDSGETIYGLGGNDLLIAAGGDDILYGGIGADEMRGGTGNDTFFVDNQGDVVLELVGEGTDTVITSINIDANPADWGNIEQFELVGGANRLTGNSLANILIGNDNFVSTLSGLGGNDTLIGGSQRDLLYGGPGDDLLIGNDGDDLLDGSNGSDDMQGGLGDDDYIVRQTTDLVTEILGQGDDTVRTYVNWTLSANVENMRMYGNAAVGIGNDLDNFMFARSIGTKMQGLEGDDRLFGREGDDFLIGDEGNDRILGAAGNDLLDGGTGDDTLNGGSGNDNIIGGAGVDRLGGDSGSDVLNGGAGADQLFGGGNADVLIGGAQRDLLSGGAGADVFVFNDGDMAGLTRADADRIADFLQGVDIIDLSGLDAIIGAGDDAFTFIDNAAFSGTAGELRWGQVGGDTMLYMDVNGDALADYAIRVDGIINFSPSDFVL